MIYSSRTAKFFILTALFTLSIFIWSLIFAGGNKNLSVAFLDIGQGDSIFIEAPNGNQILIDGGSGGAVVRELGKILPMYDRVIDVILATHPDKDHTGGLNNVLEKFSVSYFIEPGVPADTLTWNALLKKVKEKNISHVYARRGMEIDLGGGAKLLVLYPDRDVSREKDTNNASVIAMLSYGASRVLLTGDAPQSAELRLVAKDGEKLRAEILKLGHHGSRTSSAPPFLAAVHPAYAIVSAGCKNSYGHPHQEILALLEKFKIQKLATCEKGTITFKSDGENFSYKK
ncbi:MAG: ComEC/Rec2 family competence protein [Patescibacteria group bacterium]